MFASFASLGDVVYAEPKSLIGFAGPRVAEQFLGRPLPPGSHTAEFLLEHGFVDSVVPQAPPALGHRLDPEHDRLERRPPEAHPPYLRTARATRAWEAVQTARDPDRPTALHYVSECLDYWIELHGDRTGTDDRSVIAGLGQLEGQAVAVIGFERGSEHDPIDRRGGTTDAGRLSQGPADDAARLPFPDPADLPSSTRPAPTPASSPRRRASPSRSPTTMAA